MARKSSASSKAPPPPPPPSPSDADPEVDEQDGDAATAASTDNVGDISVEVNVEDLIAQLESDAKSAAPDGSARRRIEDILDEKRVAKEIMDLEDFDIEE